jgi:protocatechuate 3,4-dioxygenase beta subunit
MKRRSFIKTSSLMAMSVSAFGSIQWDGSKFIGNSVTTTDILGPFYRPGAPMRSNIVPAGSAGIPMNLVGTIYKEDGLTPVDNALIEIWQCDEDEYYDNISDEYLFRGALKTDADGTYKFSTIVPVPYKANPDNEESWRPAHIHIRVSVPEQQDLITQIYFKGDEYIEQDGSASSPQSVDRILEIGKNASGVNSVTFDVIMQKEFPLEDSVYKKIEGLYEMDSDSMIEFVKEGDLLYIKRNGQLMEGLKYIGENTFEGGLGYLKVSFEMLDKGGCKAIVKFGDKTISGIKFLKYK